MRDLNVSTKNKLLRAVLTIYVNETKDSLRGGKKWALARFRFRFAWWQLFVVINDNVHG